MTKENDCGLVVAAKLLAERRGFNPEEIACPFDKTCQGIICQLLVNCGFKLPRANWEDPHRSLTPPTGHGKCVI